MATAPVNENEHTNEENGMTYPNKSYECPTLKSAEEGFCGRSVGSGIFLSRCLDGGDQGFALLWQEGEASLMAAAGNGANAALLGDQRKDMLSLKDPSQPEFPFSKTNLTPHMP